MSNAKELAKFARDITYDTANTELSGITVQGAGGASVTTNTAWTQSSGGSTTNRIIDTFTATAGQTTFTPSVNYSYVEVYKNNVRVPTSQYNATDGVRVILNTGATAGDVLEIYAYATVGGTATGTGGLTISSVVVTDASGTALGYAGFAEVGGGYVKVTGTGFSSGISATIGGTAALSTVYNSSTEVIVRVPPKSYGSYGITLTDLLGFTVSLTNAVIYYPAASWVTDAALPDVQMDIPVSIQLQAVGGTAFALASGSTLPAGLTLNTVSGLISGTLTVFSGDSFTTSFAVNVTNNVGVTTSRTFNLFANAARFETAAIGGSTAINRYWIYENLGAAHRFSPPHFGAYDILIVGGGGGGGTGGTTASTRNMGGGGGAGGVVEKPNTILNSTSSVYYQKVSFIRITNGGTNYTSAPTVVITPVTGNTPTTVATATATVSNGAVTSISVTGNGVGYTSAPLISFTGGAGSGATAIAYIGGNTIYGITVGAGGAVNTAGSNTSIRKNALPVDWIALGGGRGGNNSGDSGGGGGSGGGASKANHTGGISNLGGAPATQPGSATGGFGFAGGGGSDTYSNNNRGYSGGGGGAAGTGTGAGDGGLGRLMTGFEIRGTNASNTLTGTRGYYGGGGAGLDGQAENLPTQFNFHVGGVGGGGNSSDTLTPRNAINGTGGGGAGGGSNTGQTGAGGLGGSGILIIKQKYGYDADILLAAGGGSSGYGPNGFPVGAGGAGGMVYTTGNQFNVLSGETYTATIGGADTNSSLVHTNYTITAIAGGSGGSSTGNSTNVGNSGGSGGGGAGYNSGGFARDGGDTTQVSTTGYGQGNRAGTGSGGGAGGLPTTALEGGPGIQWVNGITYCRGGNGTVGTSYGANSGGGAHANNNGNAGNSGIFIIRYAGPQRGSGGTITSVDGYTYHTFTSSGVFTG